MLFSGFVALRNFTEKLADFSFAAQHTPPPKSQDQDVAEDNSKVNGDSFLVCHSLGKNMVQVISPVLLNRKDS